MEKLPLGSQTPTNSLDYSNGDVYGTTAELNDLTFSGRNGAYTFSNERFTNADFSSANDDTTSQNLHGNVSRLSDFDRTVVESNHNVNYKVTTQSAIEMDGNNSKEKSKHTKLYSNNHDFRNGFINGEGEYLERTSRRSTLDLSERNDTNEDSLLFTNHEKSVKFAATQTTEAILAKLFSEKTRIPQQRYFNGGTSSHRQYSYENGNRIETDGNNSSIKAQPENMRNKGSFRNSHTLTDNFTTKDRKNGDLSETGFIENTATINNSQFKVGGKEIYHRREMDPSSYASPTMLQRNFKNSPALNGVTRLYQGSSSEHRVYNAFEDAPFSDKFSTFEDIPLPRFESTGKSQAMENLSQWRKDQGSNFNAAKKSVDKTSKEMKSTSSTFSRSPRVQSNVVDYYEKLKKEGKAATLRETSTPVIFRKGLRTKSSEMPVKNNLPNSCSAYR